MPTAEDAAHLYETWVGMGGDGIALKDPASRYRPGERSPAWLKPKPKLTLELVVAALRSGSRGATGARRSYSSWPTHTRARAERAQIRQAVRSARHEPLELRTRKRAQLVCWGVMPSGMLRHPLFIVGL